MRSAAFAFTAVLLSAMPAFSKPIPKVPDQVIATWSIPDKQDATVHTESSLTLHSGVLKQTSVLYDHVHPEGDKSSASVRLSRIAGVTKNDMQEEDGTIVYRISIDAKGKDIVQTGFGETDHDQSVPGFAVFGSGQQSQRDEALAKLCAVVAGPCGGPTPP